jgi:diguanylate cyclase (GGDEF)-like protein/PAS domain S-box-containing protein
MLRLYACLTTQHDLGFVALAAAVCLLASGVAMGLLRRISDTRGLRRAAWVGVAATVIGGGVWATHFVALLGFEADIPTGYDLLGTLGSLIVAVALLAVAIDVGQDDRRSRRIAGGIGAGLAVAAMHYSGMAAFMTEGVLRWSPGFVAASVLLGAAFGAASMLAVRRSGVGNWAASAGLFTLAVCSVHFLGMSAVSITPDPTVTLPPSAISHASLALWVAGASSALIVLSLAALMIGRHQRMAAARRLGELADAAVEGLAICEDGRIVTANESLARMTGLPPAELVGRPIADLLDVVAGTDEVLIAGQRLECGLRASDGELIPVEALTHSLVFDGRPRLAVALRDLRDRVAAEARIRFMAHHDTLTGLPNRQSFSDQLTRELQLHRRQDDVFAVLCLDLDRFKQVNDVLGHAAGDAVLKTVGERISGLLGDGDMLARLGGDEFAILRLRKCAPLDLAMLGDAILEAVSPDIDVGGHLATVGVSIGIAMFPQDGASAEDLMRNADAALYQAKTAGRDRYCFFEAELAAQLLARQRREFDLRQALARREFTVVYQPQAFVRDGEIFGFEALLRWNSPARGDVPRGEFIPLAEETGLIVAIGEWVLREACAEAASWPKPLQIAVNLSGVQLRSATLARQVHEILMDTGLAPHRLELEITETAMIEDFDLALHTLRQLKALGVRIAMDDFGTGYSSLSNLRAFPFDKIKIDRSFVQNVHGNAQASTIIRAILGLCRGLNLTVLAEGVESADELEFLDGEECREAQGYLFGAPGAISDFPEAFGNAAPVAEEVEAPKARRQR